MAILRDYGELALASEGSRPGLTGEKIFTNEDAMLLGAQNQWPEGWSLWDRPAEEATADWLAGGPPVERSRLGDVAATLWLAGVPRNLVSIFVLSCVWWIVYPLSGWVRSPEDARSCAALFIGFGVLSVAALATTRWFGLVLRDTALREDDIHWIRGTDRPWRDGLGPIVALGGWLTVAGWSANAFFSPWSEAFSDPQMTALILTVGLLISGLAPLILLSAICGDWLAAWREFPGNLIRSWPVAGVAWLATGAALAVWALPWTPAGEWIASKFSGPMVRLLWLLTAFYMAYVALRSSGLIGRHCERLAGFSWLRERGHAR